MRSQPVAHTQQPLGCSGCNLWNKESSVRLGHLRAGEARETETGQGDREARKQETAGNSRAMGASVPQKTKVMGYSSI